LAKARTKTEGDAVALHFLNEELTEVKAALAQRDAELAEAGAAGEQFHHRKSATEPAVEVGRLQLAERLLLGRSQEEAPVAENSAAQQRAQDQGRMVRRLVGAGALLAVVVLAAIFYPRLEEIVLGHGPEAALVASESEASAAPEIQVSSDAAHALSQRIVIGVPIANVRAGPSTATAVVMTLARGAEVLPVERRGSWVRIRMSAGDGTPEREGWIISSALKLTDTR
jgi:hypothetical protein